MIEDGTMPNPGTNFTESNANNSQYPASGNTIKAVFCYDNEPLYGSGAWSAAIDPGTMNNLKGRLAAQAYKDENTSDWGYTLYSYDQFNNIEWLKQDLPGDEIGTKTIAYEYDLSGNITKMLYQDGEDEAFYTWYEYDDAGRLAQILSNVEDNRSTATENANYSYFPFGNSQRLVLGSSAQGVDYQYNTRDWLTFINHQNLGSDPVGVDDRFGLVIGYHNNNEHIGSAQSAQAQYNGNISWMIWQTAENTNPYSLVGYTFDYDRANRLTMADFGYHSGSWQTCNNSDVDNISYDANGNIQTMRRYHIQSTKMDELTYDYYTDENRLKYINDTVSGPAFEMDVDDQSPGNTIPNTFFSSCYQQ